MHIKHYVNIENNVCNIYLNIIIEDAYEFGLLKDNRDPIKILDKIQDYLKNNVIYKKGTMLSIIINGVLIGTIALSTFLSNSDNVLVQNSEIDLKKDNITEIVRVLESKSYTVVEEKTNTIKNNTSNNSGSIFVQNSSTVKPSNSSENKVQSNNTTNSSPNISNKVEQNTNNISNSEELPKKEESSVNKEEVNKVDNNIYINLNNKGVITSIELEEYIVGVVAAEMPASFNVEALKAQAIAARTYTVKKASTGKTLVNSTSDQVYNTIDEMKAKWGSSFNTYYNKIKGAVFSTKGLVITYNGKYIDALYFSMTNGKTEQPEYVWAYSYPYLKCVSSSWDKNVKGFEVVKNLEYATVSKALGQTVTKDTVIEILSYTVSGRVDKIKIRDKTYIGVEIRTKLGLRSTDFTIVLNDNNISVTTRGFGHGVGLSQYGANEMAKQGYTYDKILHHYYTGVTISKCEKL